MSSIRAIRLKPMDSNNKLLSLDLNACIEEPTRPTEPTTEATTTKQGFGGGVETTTTQFGVTEQIIDYYSKCTERLHINEHHLSASSGVAANAVISTSNETVTYWTAAEGDASEAITIDLGYPMGITGFVLRTTTIVKVKVQYSDDGNNYHGNLLLPSFNALLNTDGSENQVPLQTKDIIKARYIQISPKEKLNLNFPSDLPFADLLPDLPQSNAATMALDVFACTLPSKNSSDN